MTEHVLLEQMALTMTLAINQQNNYNDSKAAISPFYGLFSVSLLLAIGAIVMWITCLIIDYQQHIRK